MPGSKEQTKKPSFTEQAAEAQRNLNLIAQIVEAAGRYKRTIIFLSAAFVVLLAVYVTHIATSYFLNLLWIYSLYRTFDILQGKFTHAKNDLPEPAADSRFNRIWTNIKAFGLALWATAKEPTSAFYLMTIVLSIISLRVVSFAIGQSAFVVLFTAASVFAAFSAYHMANELKDSLSSLTENHPRIQRRLTLLNTIAKWSFVVSTGVQVLTTLCRFVFPAFYPMPMSVLATISLRVLSVASHTLVFEDGLSVASGALKEHVFPSLVAVPVVGKWFESSKQEKAHTGNGQEATPTA